MKSSSSSSFSDSKFLHADVPVQVPSAYTGCRSIERFEKLNNIAEGAYGIVYRARDSETGDIVAIKRVKLEESDELGGFPITSLREVNISLTLRHPNLIASKEMVVGGRGDSVFMVMEYMDFDIKLLLESITQPLSHAVVKNLMRQLLMGMHHMHKRWIFHRDIKTANLLYNNAGVLKIADLGLARRFEVPLGKYTQAVVTLYYRAPELLLGTRTYGPAIDMWSIGCVFAELLTGSPLFVGAKTEILLLGKMIEYLGTPTEETWPGIVNLPHYKQFKLKQQPRRDLRHIVPLRREEVPGQTYLSDAGMDLLMQMLEWNSETRISAADALNHPYFAEHPLPAEPQAMPRFPSRENLNRGAEKKHY